MRATWSQSTARVRAWKASTLLRACSFTSSANARPTLLPPSAERRGARRPAPHAPPPGRAAGGRALALERRAGGPLGRLEAAAGRVPGPVDRLAHRVGAL